MATPKRAPQPTWAEKYAKAKADEFEQFLEASFSESALKDVQLYEVPVGALRFKCRTLDAKFMAATGVMPTSITEEVIAAETEEAEGDPNSPEMQKRNAERWKAMSQSDKVAGLQAAARMVRFICVEPRVIPGDIGNRRNAISADRLTLGDVESLVKWAKGGGGEAAGLKTFRTKGK